MIYEAYITEEKNIGRDEKARRRSCVLPPSSGMASGSNLYPQSWSSSLYDLDQVEVDDLCELSQGLHGRLPVLVVDPGLVPPLARSVASWPPAVQHQSLS
jgi:hypothetical protein